MALSKRRNTLSDALQSRQLNCPKPRIEAKASAHVARLEPGFRVLDSTAQIAPLLGLFGIVLGMIDAFQALQQAGNSVDPSLLAGGIWVALLTTAAGLAVAMPTSLVLTFFDSRVRANGYWSKARLKPNSQHAWPNPDGPSNRQIATQETIDDVVDRCDLSVVAVLYAEFNVHTVFRDSVGRGQRRSRRDCP